MYDYKRFNKYLYGRKFTLVTDHKPLQKLLGPKTGVPPIATARLQRWALVLASHQCDIEYRRPVDYGNADFPSRLPTDEALTDEEEIFHFHYV